jgi:hypothetical protein
MPTHTLTRKREKQPRGKDLIEENDLSDLKSTLVLDLCQGIIEMPALDREVPIPRRWLESAYEELHDLATTLAEHLIKSAEALSSGTSTKEGARR